MTIPGRVCQHQVKTHYPSNGALDLHVEAGQDLNAMAIFAVLVWIPQVPAALQELSLGPGCVFIQLHRGGRRPGGGSCDDAGMPSKNYQRQSAKGIRRVFA
jgi:hypothetical protein